MLKTDPVQSAIFWGAVVVAAIGLIVFGMVGSSRSLVAWEEYRTEHNCVQTGVTREKNGPFMCHNSGTGVIICQHQYTATQREWYCDGGERLWR